MADEVAVMSLAPLPFSLLHSATKVDAAAPRFQIPTRLVETPISKPVVGQRQSYHAQPEGRLPNRTAGGRMSKRQRRRKKPDRKYRSRVLTSVIQEALCSSVSLKACRVMQVLLGLMSPRLWKSVLTLNLSCPLSSLSPSTCSESREADRRGDGGRTGSDISCGKTKARQASSYLIFINN